MRDLAYRTYQTACENLQDAAFGETKTTAEQGATRHADKDGQARPESDDAFPATAAVDGSANRRDDPGMPWDSSPFRQGHK